jgi:hypothetical protein
MAAETEPTLDPKAQHERHGLNLETTTGSFINHPLALMQYCAPLRPVLERELTLGRQALIARFGAGSCRVLKPA